MSSILYRPQLDAGEELERFKREVNLTELAATFGYRLVERERNDRGRWRGSTAASNMMRHPATNDKIIIRRDTDGHWTYFSVREDLDRGTVIDFLLRRRSGGLGVVRKDLRAWLRKDRPRLPVQLFRSDVRTQSKDELAVRTAFVAARLGRSSYLASRGVTASVQMDQRFRSRYRVDARGNVLFPHCDPSSGLVVGFEAKNRGYTAFATGGRKTFWTSEIHSDDDRLVVVEASIDAFSYHQLFPYARARHLSTGGAVGTAQLALIVDAIAAMPLVADIVSATDADEGGEKLHEKLVAATERALWRHRAPVPKDWNDYLRSLDRIRTHRSDEHLER